VTVDLPTFLQKSGAAFRQTDPDVVQGCLDRATRRCPTIPWGAFADDGVFYMTAHLLSVDPMGMSTLLAEAKDSPYIGPFRELETIVSCGAFLVSGGC